MSDNYRELTIEERERLRRDDPYFYYRRYTEPSGAYALTPYRPVLWRDGTIHWIREEAHDPSTRDDSGNQ